VRWLLIHPGPSWSVADVHNGWAEALRGLGEQVEEYDTDARLRFYNAALTETGELDEDGRPGIRKFLDREQAIQLAVDGILGAAYRWWPDVIMCVSAFFTPPWLLEVLRARGHKIVMLMTESPYQDDFQLKMAEYADLTLLNDPVNLAAYRETGPAEYMRHAYRPEVHYPPPPGTQPEYDFAFVGTGFPSRIRFFSQMDLAGLNVTLRGLWMDLPEDSPMRDWTATEADDCVDNAKTAGIYRRAAASINLYRTEAEDEHAGEGYACGPREIELAACGLWFARDSRPESDELFPMLPAYTTPGQAGELIRWYLAHPGQRETCAAAARQAVADRTFENNARSLLRLLDRQPITM
jgi:spore maturation protein CgeB